MNPKDRRRLGRTSVETTVLGLGGSTVGNLYAERKVSQGDALATIEAAWDSGIRYFDTAPLYGAGLGEQRMAQVLHRHRRSSYVLSTKVGVLLDPLAPEAARAAETSGGLPFETIYDYSYDGTLRSIEESQRRLGTDRFEIALIHDIDVHTHGVTGQPARFREALAGAYPALRRLRDEGTLAAIGVGVNDWRVCQACLEAADFDCFLLAGRYTLLEQEALQRFLPACQERGIGVIIGAPYNSGILARGAVEGARHDDGVASTAILDRVRRLERICESHSVSLEAAALRFPLGHPAVSSVIPGARSAGQVHRNIRCFEEIIPHDLWLEMKAKGLIAEAAPLPLA